ncbi:hypothetical protein GGX14DRAFT_345403 [Mycena pura]|uniref:Translation initiation factor 3 N-terminal domain-containing protein n=1 Tax=Mycena pura TaxID=153505 RepID=A0AAD6YTS8_9AGAR|nr:hypothetical protein GGX14DRAFT_345403 [Mycena pura]
MNTFSVCRPAARTLLHRLGPSLCPNALSLHPHLIVRHKTSKTSKTPAGNPRDEHIKHAEVSLVEDNVLVKLSLKRLLNSIDRRDQWVELVSDTPEPIVRIINKKQELLRQKKLKERQREAARLNVVKEVQLTWGSEQSDMDHKLARVRAYLEMGARVNIVFSAKPKTVPPRVKSQQEKVQSTIELMADISTTWQPVEWRKNTAVIFLRGVAQSGAEKLVTAEPAAIEAEMPTESKEEPASEQPPLPSPSQAAERPQRNFVDLSEYEYLKPATRNPLSAMKPEKKYGKRRSTIDPPRTS